MAPESNKNPSEQIQKPQNESRQWENGVTPVIGEVCCRDLFENAPDAILVLSLEGRILEANSEACVLLNIDHQTLIGMQFAEFVPQRWKEEVARICAGTTNSPIKHIEITPANIGSFTIPTETKHNLVNLADKQVLLLYIRDISEYRQNEQTLQQRNRYLTLLNQAGQVFSSSLDLDAVLSAVLGQLRNILNATAASIWLIDERTGELVCRDSTEPWFLRGWRLTLGQGIIGWTALKGESVFVPDTRLDDRHFKGVDQESGTEIRCILSVPLKVKQRTIGVLQVVDRAANYFHPEDLTSMESLAAMAAIAIENARLFKQVSLDAENRAALIQEINHRVKNNLSSIIGLLYGELRYAKETQNSMYTDLLQDLIGRVQSMAQVHAMLSNFEWMPLPLDELTRQMISNALHILPNGIHVDVDITPANIKVSSSQATNLALIINELTTNTIKYGLKNRTSGKITVNITREDSETVCFEFRNDGSDFPDEIVLRKQYNLGLHLIDTLVRRGLLGTLTLDNDHGPVTTIRFKRV